MTEPSPTTLADEFAAALDWWRSAGVDHDFGDDVTEWLAAHEPDEISPQPPAKLAKNEVAAPPPPKKIGGEKESWPEDLAQFHNWWVTDSSIDDGGAYPALAPRGSAGAKLMIVVAEPEEHDSDTLLSGPQGRLLDGILKAAGFAAEDTYIAATLRRHTPVPDWAALKAAGLCDLLAHHIALAAPNRILTFGRNIPPLLGNDTAQGAAILHNINHDNRSTPVMSVGSLAQLLRSAGRRQRFWQHWLEWTDS
ncbi:uracil-DNA glycosylase family protein [Pontixanthobacter aquaemixtae]|uniref:Uracil-DNA glycosylase-like domain-containing protein n=1 Tax=Pontixanthobacter aquaemixtae TaxID=1958940 RepID=A0A844ZRC9_9SPHN|nr:uracil-DNA glycosylase family protein [Pontixanthobacter aquaemixtae]MXO90415.1 hypothetical protein [Pontixanthobacter aquaemixtae]